MIGRLLGRPVEAAPCEDVSQWWPRYRELGASLKEDQFDHGLAAGFAADRVAWAFASGYQAALHSLLPDAPADRICAFCVTEADGNSPKAIKSTLRRDGKRWLLNGAKRWTTLGPEGALFYVAARDEAASAERPAIKLVKLACGAAGLIVEVMPQARFVPEVPHARLRFENAIVEATALLEGDGYDRYVKPFRTMEDIYVNAAILAYLVREARRLAWPAQWLERTLSLLIALRELARADPSSPHTHVALAGALAISADLIGETDKFWKKAPADPAALRWHRDQELLKIASGAREQRTKRAWERLRA